jgi:hypothetical protein
MDDGFREIERLLKQNIPVLFCGTPCQTAGLQSFLGDHSYRLVCVDLACHGVPSPAFWQQYVNEISTENQSPLRDFSFRDKSTGWRRYSLRAEFDHGKMMERPHTQDPYMWLFLKGLTLRSSCYACLFRGLRRNSDLTLADLWGAEKTAPELDDDQGVSLVLIQTEKGKALWSAIADRVRFQAVDAAAALESNPRLMQSPDRPPLRDDCFSLLGQRKLSDIVQYCLNQTNRGSSGWWNALRRGLHLR